MKRVIIFTLLALLACGVSYGQKSYRFAHIVSQKLIESMPERDSALVKLKAYEKEIMDQMDQLQVEANKKYQEYMQKRDGLTPSLREVKEREIAELQQRVQEYQMAAQKDFQEMQGKLMQPIIDKANAAIEKVGREQGFLYVFDRSMGTILFASAESVDILEMVQKELGIKPSAKPTAKPTNSK